MKRGRIVNKRVCPVCGDTFDKRSKLIIPEGVSDVWVHGGRLCVRDDDPSAARDTEVTRCGCGYYEDSYADS